MFDHIALDRRYILHIIIVLCVYGGLFGLGLWYINEYALEPDDLTNMLCFLSGFPIMDIYDIDRHMILMWIFSVAMVYVLTGAKVYERVNSLRYIAMIRYGSYARFYRNLVNLTVVHSFVYASLGVVITFTMYGLWGNGMVSPAVLVRIWIIYCARIVMLCLMQTVCMLLSGGYMAGLVILLVSIFGAVCGHWILESGWIWLPVNWGMYARSRDVISGGVPPVLQYMQVVVDMILWICMPTAAERIIHYGRAYSGDKDVQKGTCSQGDNSHI